MANSREQILSQLRAVQSDLEAGDAAPKYLPMVPLEDRSPQALVERFAQQARQLSSEVHRPASQAEAIQVILDLLGEERRVLSWSFEHIPLPGLAKSLAAQGVRVAAGRDAAARVGITGADAALAATGSLVLMTGAGKPRLASLLPPVHIAVLHQSQILADLETWVGELREKGLEAFQRSASAMIISGPSRTADIAMQLILGMHGPGELHIVILD